MENEENTSAASGFIKGLIVAIFALLMGCCIGALTCFIVIIAPLLWLVLFLVDSPYFHKLASAVTWVSCEAPSWLGGSGGDRNSTACVLNDFLDEAKKLHLDQTIKGQFDCSVFPPDLWYYCSDSLTLADDSAIPPDKQYLLAVYRAAGSYFDVPWQLLAALDATNSRFGDENCTNTSTDKRSGGGHYDFSSKEWAKFKVDAGEERKEEFDQGGHKCSRHKADPSQKLKINQHYIKIKSKEDIEKYRKNPEDKWYEGDDADPLDAVDATFTMARMLQYYGVSGSTWSAPADYTGALDNGCNNTDGQRDGTIYSYTGSIGFNSKLPTTPEFDALYSYWTRRTPFNGSTLPADFKAWTDIYGDPPSKLQPGEIRYPGPGHETRNVVMTHEEFTKAAAAVASAMGLAEVFNRPIPATSGDTLNKYYSNTVFNESGGNYMVIMYPNQADPNDKSYLTWSRGMTQFIPGTFESSRVPGYDNLYNPMDNMLASMNRMKNATGPMVVSHGQAHVIFDNKDYGYWPMGSGWNPGRFVNPYTDGNHSNDANHSNVKKPYTGPDILTDKLHHPVTSAVSQNYGTDKNHTQCYIATVWTWYSAILNSGYSADGGSGTGGGDPNTPPGSFIWPSQSHLITSGIGPRCTADGNCHFHAGIDIGMPEGSQIVASASGKVLADPLAPGTGPMQTGQCYGPICYGCTIFIAHNGNYFTRYAHVLSKSSRLAAVGDEVSQGQKIVKSGAASQAVAENCLGHSFGAHLHFEIRKGTEIQDPAQLLP